MASLKLEYFDFLKYLDFLTQIRKGYAIFVICIKNKTICETGS